MIARLGLIVLLLVPGTIAQAQDIVGIELCTRETSMDRRTGCLQSNIEYLQRLIAKNAAAAQQKLAAANAEIAALKSAIANLQTIVEKLQATANKLDAEAGKPGAK
jgi:chromosome segregation ATPase